MHRSSLNHVYRLVWNAITHTWVAVSEITRGRSKAGKSKATLAAVALLTSGMSHADPTGGLITSGVGSIAQTANHTVIQQQSQNLNLQWQSFNVGAGQSVTFNQPNAQALAVNQILDTNGSRILGNIHANGQVWLINPNGVYFGQGAQVNVGGLVASTLNPLSNTNGQVRFGQGGTGSVLNEGSINATNGGYVALLGNTVINQGQITAPQGTVAMGAGSAVTLSLMGNSLLGITVDESTLNNLASNRGLIQAQGGQVLLSAGARESLLASAVNNTGIIEAQTVQEKEGRIILLAGMAAGTSTVDGTLDASAQTGNGGFIETSAAKVRVADSANITTKAHNTDGDTGHTGTWLIDPNDYTIAASGGDISGAQLSANLALNNITIQSLQGATAGNGDIVVNDSIDATGSGNTLTLQAERDINVNKTVKVDGLNLTAVRDVNVNNVVDVGTSLTVNYAANTDFTANTAVRPSGNGALNMKMNGNGFVGKINLGASAMAIINGNSYTVLRAASELAAIPANTTNRYVLANDVSLAAFADWVSNNFFGSLDGLGHEVSGLSITSNRANGGFFAVVGNSINNPATVGNFGVSGNINFTNYSAGARNVGGLAAYAGGAAILRNVYSNVSVAVDSSTGTILGGLIGSVANTSTLTNAFAKGGVTASSTAAVALSHSVGGLIGQIGSGTVSIANVYAIGAASASGSTLANVGGLIGNVGSSLTLRYAYATGAASATTTGGAVNAGGLLGTFGVGANNVSVDNVFATGAVSGGGGTLRLGGLVGNLGSNTGGAKFLTNSYWDATKTGQSGAFSENTQAQPNTNTAAVAAIGTVGATFPNLDSAVWDITNGTPSLKVFASAPSTVSLTYTLSALTGTYTYKGAAFNLTDLWTADTIFGSTYSGWALGTDYTFSQGGNTVTGFTNAGTYNNITVNVLKNGFSAATTGNTAGALTIGKADLTVTTNDFLGSNTASASVASTTGLQGSTDSVSGVVVNNNTLSVNFGQNTLASNYNTTVVVPGASGADLNVNRALSVNGLNLTLQSDKNININNTITAQGATDKVSLVYGQGAANAGNTSEYVISLTDTTFNGKINLQKGQNFATKLGSDGPLLNYTVITELGAPGSTTGTDLQGMNGAANLAGRYVLGGDIDAAATSTWNLSNQGIVQGFAPIMLQVGRTTFTPFSGTFDGLGHTVSNITINRPISITIGLFGRSTGDIRHVGLLGGSVTGQTTVGALASMQTGGSIAHVFSTTNVNGSGADVGGLIGRLEDAASVRYARSTGTVSNSATASGTATGGLIGSMLGSTVTHSHASGNVQALSAAYSGGLVGHATSSSTLTDVSASGQVTGYNQVGGLVGRLADSTLSRAFASGAVTSGADNGIGFGGLLGRADNSIIGDVFATGAVNAGAFNEVGGIAGILAGGSLTNAYATGAVMGSARVGGLIGVAINNAALSNSFWNTQTTGRDNAVGIGVLNANSSGNAGKTTAQLQNAFTFIDAGWDFSNVWGKSITGANNGLMQLRSLSTGLYGDYVTVANTSKSYGDANPTTPTITSTGNGASNVTINGFGTAIAQKTDAGTYDYSAANVLSVTNSQGRSTYVNGKLTIDPKAVTVSGITAADKAYDGTKTATVDTTHAVYTGLVDGDGLSTTATGEFADKNASATAQTVTLSATTTANEGTKLSNYTVTEQTSATAKINQKALTVTATQVSKTYDGGTSATGTGNVGTLVSGDLVNSAGSQAFVDKNAGTGKTVKASGVTLKDANGADMSGNYAITYVDNTTSSITAKELTISGFAASGKTYDGNATASITNAGSLVGVVQADAGKVSLGNTGATFSDKNAATGKTVTLNGTGLSGAEAANYKLASAPVTTTADIAQKELTISGFAVSNKTYDGNTTASITHAGSLQGVVQADVAKVSLGNTGATFADKNAATGKTATLNGTSLSGDEAANYKLATAAVTTTANITPKALSISGTTAASKTYDGSATAAVSVGTVRGLVDGETLGITTATGQFADKNVGNNKNVTVAYTLTDGVGFMSAPGPFSQVTAQPGAKASNYTLAGQTLLANIAQKELTVSGFAASDKTYDATRTAIIANSGSLVGLVQADVGKVALNNTGATYADQQVGQGKTVTLNGSSLSGLESRNYRLADVAVTSTASITPAELIYVATPVSVFMGQPLSLGGTVTGFVGEDTLANAVTGQATWVAQGNLNQPGRKAIEGSGLSARSGNYTFRQATGNATALELKVGSPSPEVQAITSSLQRGQGSLPSATPTSLAAEPIVVPGMGVTLPNLGNVRGPVQVIDQGVRFPADLLISANP